MHPTIIRGRRVYSPFRRRALLDKLKAGSSPSAVEDIEAFYVYFLEHDGPLVPRALERARMLLDAVSTPVGREPGLFYVTPRKGTLSPWSSKATDIFHHCGLVEVRRVERGIGYRLFSSGSGVLDSKRARQAAGCLYDRMTEGVYEDVSDLFRRRDPEPSKEIDILNRGIEALRETNVSRGLALSEEEIRYLFELFKKLGRNPRDVELVMFGQVNSEHCRHKIFNASWIIDGTPMKYSLFDMIRNTHALHPRGVRVAYRDNSGVIEGFRDRWFRSVPAEGGSYRHVSDDIDILIKVETHNHPTAISPYPGAATGVGGEIRDEAATGTGGRSKAGLCAFMVSNLNIPGFRMPWEYDDFPFPDHLATPLQIMIEGPIGGARFGNEFGRPQLCGVFKTFELHTDERLIGYHKPVMAAGGMGNIRRNHTHKKKIERGARILQIGGPALRIGLGGGAASSMDSGENRADLDFDSVQRDNAEMQRRCQEVVNACIALEENNPVLSIHDVGAGGLSNACPELVAESGATFVLRDIPNEETSMSPMEIWCNEAQERFVLAVADEDLETFLAICRRERCPAAVIGSATGDGRLVLKDDLFLDRPIDMELEAILGRPPRMVRDVRRIPFCTPPLNAAEIDPAEALERVLRLPAVSAKNFLITIADRSVTGLVARDQMVGPFQVPVADSGVTLCSFRSYRGEAFSMGECTALALVSGPASGRMAVAEALTNIASVFIGEIGNVKLSANWMCACGEPGEDALLYDTVRAVGMEFCPRLGIAIPVGKDSLSMRAVWKTDAGKRKVTSPLTLVVSAFAPVHDARKTVTPDLKPLDSELFLVDLGEGRNRLGASALAQVYGRVGSACPDIDDPGLLARFFSAVQECVEKDLIAAYHDRSDGGLAVTILEMAFAGQRGFDVSLDAAGESPVSAMFAEEAGAVFQVDASKSGAFLELMERHDLSRICRPLGTTTPEGECRIRFQGRTVVTGPVRRWRRAWSELTFHMQTLRDNPECAREEFEAISNADDSGPVYSWDFDPDAPVPLKRPRPRVAILREQGVNGYVEMAAAFEAAGFESVDVHMTDLLSGEKSLEDFHGMAACGGFSYGDVLGAGSGWARSILLNPALREAFERFFRRPQTFSLGVCNGCQMLAQLKSIIPGAADWCAFSTNRSEQFEARFVNVHVEDSASVFFRDMAGSLLGIAVAHGEGRCDFSRTGSLDRLAENRMIAMRYVDGAGRPAERYPFNPNGSPKGITALTSKDGRVTVMMPHPERVFRSIQWSYRPRRLTSEFSPWIRMFQNARKFLE